MGDRCPSPELCFRTAFIWMPSKCFSQFPSHVPRSLPQNIRTREATNNIKKQFTSSNMALLRCQPCSVLEVRASQKCSQYDSITSNHHTELAMPSSTRLKQLSKSKRQKDELHKEIHGAPVLGDRKICPSCPGCN